MVGHIYMLTGLRLAFADFVNIFTALNITIIMHSDKLGKQRIFTELTTCIVLGTMFLWITSVLTWLHATPSKYLHYQNNSPKISFSLWTDFVN